MDRYQLRVRRSRASGFPYKRESPRDTPLKPAQRRRNGKNLTSNCLKGNRMLLPSKRYYTLREEPEEDDMNNSSVKPASLEYVKPVSNCKPALLCNHAFTKNPINQTALHTTPVKEETSHEKMSQAGYPATQKTPVLHNSKDGDSPRSVTSCSMEPDTTSSSEEEDGDSGDYFSSGSATLSSFPSPEIFRKDNVISMNSSAKEESSLYLHNKNSTLLDVSHAKSIQMQQPPNLSAIIDASSIHIEKNCVTRHPPKPEPDGDMQKDSFKSGLQRKTPPKLIVRKPILYKKVWFKSPTIAETLEAKPIPSLTSELSNLPKQVKPDPNADPSKSSETDCKEETLPLKVKLKRPVKISPVKAKFFDFGSDGERDAFFRWMRERCDKLKNPVLFPFMLGTQ